MFGGDQLTTISRDLGDPMKQRRCRSGDEQIEGEGADRAAILMGLQALFHSTEKVGLLEGLG